MESAAVGGEEAAEVEALVGEDAGGDDVVIVVVLRAIKPGGIGTGAQGVCGEQEGDLKDGEGAKQGLVGEVSGGGEWDSHRFFAAAGLGRWAWAKTSR